MKKNFEEVEITLYSMAAEEVITTSGDNPGDDQVED